MLEPITESIEDIHNGDSCLIRDWPLSYLGLEPFNMRRRDWTIRYSSVFRVPHYNSPVGSRPPVIGLKKEISHILGRLPSESESDSRRRTKERRFVMLLDHAGRLPD
jgi:hypothetical protein